MLFMKIRICVVTGSRSEYGLMCRLMHDLKLHNNVDLKIIVTGSHLSGEFGLTYQDIESDGFLIDYKLPGSLSTQSKTELAKTVGIWTGQFAEVLTEIQPDLVLIMGDRYELVSVASACTLLGIPLGHISGGEITEGAIDDQIRHSITKAAHLHFVANEYYGDRVRQMGEENWRICKSGEPGLDSLLATSILSADDLSAELNLDLQKTTALVTYHPVTLENTSVDEQLKELFEALNVINMQFVITYPNADAGSHLIISRIKEFAENNKSRVVVRKSLGHQRYVSLLKIASVMIGNSSSGLVEAPAFNLPVVNIGTRQAGRMRGSNVFDVDCKSEEIINGVALALSYDRNRLCMNPYGDGKANARIIDFIFEVFKSRNKSEILKKLFIDRPFCKKLSQIGGYYEFDPNNRISSTSNEWRELFNLHRNSVLVGSGRSAFELILDEIDMQDKVLLVPDYLCGEVQIPTLKKRKIKYRYYSIAENLTISADHLLAKLLPDVGAILMINYFGIRDHSESAIVIRDYAPGVIIIEDTSQAVYNLTSQDIGAQWADFSFGSLTKMFPLPDGGYVRSKKPINFRVPKASNHQGLAAYLAGLLKYQFMNQYSYSLTTSSFLEKDFLYLFAVAALDVPEKPISISRFSLAQLERYPFLEWMRRRKDNYQFLMELIRQINEISLISEEIFGTEVPLFLPIKVDKKHRDKLREYLRFHFIYCPVHWALIEEINGSKFQSAIERSQTILSLPVDHRYGITDMERISDCIKNYWRRDVQDTITME